MPYHLNLEAVLEMPCPLICIAGSTASGKSALAFQIAQQYNGVIINADSQQMYQGLPLLTAQPSLKERKEVSHTLYDCVPNEAPGRHVMEWIDDVVILVHRCHTSGYLPIVVGGTGFYLYALEEGLSPFPAVKRMTPSELLEHSTDQSLYERLIQVDPVSAKRIPKEDKQRILRALCVYSSTQAPLSYWQEMPKIKFLSHCFWHKIYMHGEKSVIQHRIQTRFKQACFQGLCDEISKFSLTPASPLSRSIGIKSLKSWQNDERSWQDAKTSFLTETWHYAKRQRTWFKRYFTADHIITLE
ncbi:tRNA (adenosine(37)-N6)-dimethylallyltransferase MiaA [Holospora curviuscula]|uniref:tRNA dimethylallyltransferase n=1 Tax=Holospora curviuscula TaxID=1082868 RepID=A0A2S5R6T3_9PROT|nr:tRNA (adenosine(37)-N6)-dimethylallyltransferase MiaA [Holospora curviuscula]PPE02993.1 tRNA dimethylallyltransferase [Holospora curviuscula]